MTASELSVRLSQQVMYAPGNVRITAYVEPDDSHRVLKIEADSEVFYRSSTMPLEGARAARQHTVYYANLPAANYLIRVTLADATAPVAVVSEHLRVVEIQADEK
jgi:hypothetical protein